MKTFAYCQSATSEKDISDQILAIRLAKIDFAYMAYHRFIKETISDSIPAMERPLLSMLIHSTLQPGDSLVVMNLTVLGKNANDLRKIEILLEQKGVSFVNLDLSINNLISSKDSLERNENESNVLNNPLISRCVGSRTDAIKASTIDNIITFLIRTGLNAGVLPFSLEDIKSCTKNKNQFLLLDSIHCQFIYNNYYRLEFKAHSARSVYISISLGPFLNDGCPESNWGPHT